MWLRSKEKKRVAADELQGFVRVHSFNLKQHITLAKLKFSNCNSVHRGETVVGTLVQYIHRAGNVFG